MIIQTLNNQNGIYIILKKNQILIKFFRVIICPLINSGTYLKILFKLKIKFNS